MGHHQKVEKADLYTSTLDLCRAGKWSPEEMKRVVQNKYADSVKTTAKVLTDAFQQGRNIAEVKILLKCFSKADYLSRNGYRQAELFYILFKNLSSNRDSIYWRTDLNPVEKYAVAFLFSKGLVTTDFEYGIRYHLNLSPPFNYKSLILFLKENYLPSSQLTNSDLIPRKQFCGEILKSEFSNGLSMNEEIFSDDFCPDLADQRLKQRRGEKIGLLYNETKEENKILDTLKSMVPGDFTNSTEIIPYARDVKHFQGGLFFQRIKTDKILQETLDFLSPPPQERITYILWSRFRNALPLNIDIKNLKEVSISTLVNELTDYFAAADYGDPNDPNFRMKKNKDYFKKIYESLPKAERAAFVDQVATEYLAKIKSSDKKSEIREEGVALLDSLNRWWAFDPDYIDKAIIRLKT